jgi:hypothetical protein
MDCQSSLRQSPRRCLGLSPRTWHDHVSVSEVVPLLPMRCALSYLRCQRTVAGIRGKEGAYALCKAHIRKSSSRHIR